MDIKITSKQSIYIEAADKIEKFIKLGVYKEGEKLPSCRELAMQLRVNPNTIARAYSLLEERGLVATFQKKGIYVKLEVNQEDSFEEVESFLNHLKNEGLKKEKVMEIIKKVYGSDEV